MSEEFEYIDATSIDIPVRRRKPKYTHKLWEAQTPKDYDRYLLAASRNNQRRQERLYGKYNPDIDPHAGRILDRHRYEIECETVFHADPESIKFEEIIDFPFEQFHEIFDIVFNNGNDIENVNELLERASDLYDLAKLLLEEDPLMIDYVNDLSDVIKELIWYI